MALPTHRTSVLLQLLVVALALAAALRCADAARAPDQQGQAPAEGGGGAGVPPVGERLVVVDKRGGLGYDATGHHHHDHGSGGGHKHRHNSAPGSRDGVWRAGGLAATAVAAAWLL